MGETANLLWNAPQAVRMMCCRGNEFASSNELTYTDISPDLQGREISPSLSRTSRGAEKCHSCHQETNRFRKCMRYLKPCDAYPCSFDNNQQTPHLLFHGPPGTGKTSTIHALARRIYGEKSKSQMVLELNASDDRTLETIQSQVKMFASVSLFICRISSCCDWQIMFSHRANIQRQTPGRNRKRSASIETCHSWRSGFDGLRCPNGTSKNDGRLCIQCQILYNCQSHPALVTSFSLAVRKI